MVLACARWLGVRLDLLCALFIGAVAFAGVFLSQDASKSCLNAIESMHTPYSMVYHIIRADILRVA